MNLVEDPWVHQMRRGNFEAAWRISDEILRSRAGTPCLHLPRHEQYVWTGAPLAGRRVLVRCYHGLGDTIQFIRYLPMLRRVARETVVWAQPRLLPLLRTASGIDRLLALHDGVPDVDFEVDVELMELPYLFRTTLATIPAAVPYLHVPSEPSSLVPHRSPSPALNVGIVWRSGDWDDRRSIPTRMLAPLVEIPGVRWHVFQQGAAVDEWPPEWGEIDATDDPLELARRMRRLDLMVSVDSFPAHLAGALAVPTWLLLHADPDWRWMLGCSQSPWYPTMRLWRQSEPGEWESMIERIAAALAVVAPRFSPVPRQLVQPTKRPTSNLDSEA